MSREACETNKCKCNRSLLFCVSRLPCLLCSVLVSVDLTVEEVIDFGQHVISDTRVPLW